MSRQILLACVLLGAGCQKSAGNQNKDTAPPVPEKVPIPQDNGPGMATKGGTPTVGGAPSDDARFHLHADEGTMTIDKAEGKAGAELAANIKVAPASGLHLATDFPIKITLEPPSGVKLAKTELTAGGRDKTQGDAATLSEQLLAFSVKATADKAGAYEIKGTFKFGVCDKESCHPKRQPITITVAAN